MKKTIICLLASTLMLGISACAPRHHGSCAHSQKPGCSKCAKHEGHGKKHCDCKKCQSKKKCPRAK